MHPGRKDHHSEVINRSPDSQDIKALYYSVAVATLPCTKRATNHMSSCMRLVNIDPKWRLPSPCATCLRWLSYRMLEPLF